MSPSGEYRNYVLTVVMVVMVVVHGDDGPSSGRFGNYLMKTNPFLK